MESQLNYFRASNPGERVPAELAATGFFGMRVLAVAQGGFRAGSEDSADPEETAAEAVEESTGEFLEVLLQERIRVKDEPHGALPSGIGPGDPVSMATIEAALQADVHGLLFDGTLMPSALMPDLPASGEDSDPSEAPASPQHPAERARCGGFADGGGERIRGFAVPPCAAPEEERLERQKCRKSTP